ncbi:MAG TPA: hypothetical protein VMS14_09310 [Ilumatobacteraceae bacterium]|jgi:hypothetical protein|nr:hypothetical protein [Ilumatobacteraceae bacterium]
MKKVLSAFGVLGAALVLLGAPVGAQTPGDITATITAAPSAPAAGSNIIVTAAFTSPQPSAAAQVQISSPNGTPNLVSFTAGLSSCVTTTNALTCQWTQPAPNVSPQTLVVSVPAGASGSSMTFTANVAASAAGSTFTQKATTTVTVGQATTTTIAGATTTVSTSTTTATTVAPPPTEAPTTVAPTTTAAGTLPATGSNSEAPLVIALVAIAAGVLLVGGARLLKSRS